MIEDTLLLNCGAQSTGKATRFCHFLNTQTVLYFSWNHSIECITLDLIQSCFRLVKSAMGRKEFLFVFLRKKRERGGARGGERGGERGREGERKRESSLEGKNYIIFLYLLTSA